MVDINNIKTELLIDLVREKPGIWDKSLESDKDKHIKESVCRKIKIALQEGFQL